MNASHFGSRMIKLVVWLAAFLVLSLLLILLAYIIVQGVPHLSFSLFEPSYTSQNRSLFPALVNTLWMIALSLGMALPIGIGAAVYLTEYAKGNSIWVKLMDITTETLAGIPSIVYGLFGYLLFNVTFGWGYSLLGGSITLALMILPFMIRTTQEALLAVPKGYREGSFGLGAGKLRTVFGILLPCAGNGIVSGTVLAVGRLVGETAALIFTAGTVAGMPENVMGSGRTLAVHMYCLLSEGLAMEQAQATALILLIVVALINSGSYQLLKRLQKKRK